MNRVFSQVVVVACCVLALVGVSLAQQQPGQQGQQGQQGQAGEPSAGGQTKKPAPVVGKIGVTLAQAEIIAKGYRASKLVNADVYNEAGDKIGKVDDMVIAPDGKVTVAILDVGGFLGIGRHRVAIPMEQFSSLAPKLVLPGATKEALKQLPQFEYART